MFKPLMPFEWDPPSSDWQESHFSFTDANGESRLHWPLPGVSLLVPKVRYHPNLEEIQDSNQGVFRAYEYYGYSVANFHEFLLLENGGPVKNAAFQMGKSEITFGKASPLAAFVFDAYHRAKYFGEWYDITSLRILGPSLDQVEAAFIAALSAYDETFHVLPRPYQIDESFLFDDEDDATDVNIHEVKPPIADALLPLRFFYLGLQQSDDVAASINFYKVIEFFSFVQNEQQISKLRHDGTLSDADFSKQILKILSKDEKGPIFSLLERIVSQQLLIDSYKSGLCSESKLQQFSEALYSFRNSIVHGKFSYGYDLQSDSVLTQDSSAAKWRVALKQLASRCIELFSPKQI